MIDQDLRNKLFLGIAIGVGGIYLVFEVLPKWATIVIVIVAALGGIWWFYTNHISGGGSGGGRRGGSGTSITRYRKR